MDENSLIINIDSEDRYSDWLKGGWDLPDYKSTEFMEWLNRTGVKLTKFRKLPVYKGAVKLGLIVNDQWVGRGEQL